MNIINDEIIALIKSIDSTAYLVGGVVRDFLLGKPTNDKDIIVKDSSEFCRKFSEKYDCTVIPLDKELHIYRIVMPDKINYIDVVEPIEGSLEQNIKARDFTINALAYSLETDEILDIVGGLDDLKTKTLRLISEENIINDPLRILRAYRFSSTLGFNIEEKTQNLIKKHLDLLMVPAVERRNYEVLKLFEGEFADATLDMMSDIIDKMYPIFIDVKKVPKNTHHHLDLFHHSIETVKQLQLLYEKSDKFVKEHLETKSFGGFSRLAYLKFAGFLHDIGKFSCWTIEGERHRFFKHESVGENLAKDILKKDKFSKKQIEYITSMIKNHMYPSQVVSSEDASQKTYIRYIRKMDPDVIDNILLAKADRLSARGEAVTDAMVQENLESLDRLLEFYASIKETLKPLPKLVNGQEVMKMKHLKPSPVIGVILDDLYKEQLAGNITDREQALAFIRDYEIT